MVVPIHKSEVADDILTLFIAILMFYTIPRMPVVGQYFDQYPLIIFGIAVALLIYRKRIIEMFKGK